MFHEIASLHLDAFILLSCSSTGKRSGHPQKIDQPSTIFEQLNWLKETGFRHVDVAWMQGGHAILVTNKLL